VSLDDSECSGLMFPSCLTWFIQPCLQLEPSEPTMSGAVFKRGWHHYILSFGVLQESCSRCREWRSQLVLIPCVASPKAQVHHEYAHVCRLHKV
jgi:hypothetical protein